VFMPGNNLLVPFPKAADIGIAMGMTGTDVAKQASDIILTDDNFATIEKAIVEGRGVYENIKKSVIFLLSSNLGEIMTMFLAVLCGLPWLLLSRSFLSIATASGHVGRKVYRAKAVRCRSISSALLDRELRRFTSSANYMLNCGFGTLFLVLASGFLLWQGRELLELVSQSFPERSGAMPVLLAFVLCLLSAMNDTTAPSVSLEGKQLWLAQSLPVSPWQVLRAKLRLQLLITIPPMLLCLVCLLAVYPGSPLELLFIAVTALSYALLMALLGLFLGLKMPNLSWTNEVVPIKQSACVALSLFGGWAVAMIPGALYLLTGIGSLDPLLYLSVVTALLLILSAVLSLWVKRTGSCIFASL